ncbi:MAG: response regulator, partial [Caldithrix sp.]
MQNGNILIIDDEPKMCKILRFALEPVGYQVTTAESAEE